MKYIEKETPQGYILKVDRIKGHFSIFKDHKLIPNPSERYSVRYPLQRIIFVGDIFRKDFIDELDIGFFYVSQQQVIIPFRVSDVSDIRHIKLPGYTDCDMLPISIYYFNDLDIGMYLNIFRSGIQYFVLEAKFDRSYIVYIKQIFPFSRVLIYRPEQILFSYEETFIMEKYRSSADFYMKLLKKDEIGLLSQNILFMARVFIHKKKWKNLYDLPKQLDITFEEARSILYYIEVELKHFENDKNTIIELKNLIKFFDAASHLISMDKDKAFDYLKNNFLNLDFIVKIENMIHRARSKLAYSDKDHSKRSYYHGLLLKLKEKKLIFK